MFTVTGAWSKVPAAPGSVSVTITGIVALLPDPDATPPTEETVPGVLDPSGSVTVTSSPARHLRLHGGIQRDRDHVPV